MSLSIDTNFSIPTPPKSEAPRMITAEEILAERRELLASEMYWPHDYNSRCGVWVACDCPKCRDYYDPTGEETAKYLNMEFPSWFDGQAEKPSFFGFSKVAKQSYFATIQKGFYIGNAKKPACLEDVMLVLTPPLPLKPKRIQHISDTAWDEFLLSEDKTFWTRRTYKEGRNIRYEDGTNPPILFGDLPQKLKELFSS
jgi:hypothetical protein